MPHGARLCVAFLLVASMAQAANVLADSPSDYLQYETLTYRDRVESAGLCTRTLETRVVLRTAAAVAEFGQLQWPYVVGYDEVAFEDVTIEKADGRKVDVKNGLTEDVNPFGVTATAASSDIRFKKLTIPGLEPGDRLSYRIVACHRPLAPGHAFGEMKIPPVAGDPLQTYELDVPRDGAIRVRLRPGLGTAWEDVPSPPDRLVRRLRARVPTPGPDTMITKKLLQEWSDPDVIFTSFATWNDVARWWWELSKDRLQPDAAVTKQSQALASPGVAPRQNLLALHGFVAANIRYLNVGFGIGRMQPHAASEVLASRYGDCKDKHALLAALAASAGIDVRPVLVGTARNELRDDVPAPQQFDHMISVARIGPEPETWLWLDSTDRYGVAGYLGPTVRGKRALLIEPTGEGRIVQIPADPPFVPSAKTELKATLRPDGVLSGKSVLQVRSDGEALLRAALEAVSPEQRTEILKKTVTAYWTDAKVTSAVVSDLSNSREPLRMEIEAEKAVQTDGGKTEWNLWVPLPDFGLPDPPDTTTPDTEKIELDRRDFEVRAEIEVPEGWTARAPLSVSLERPFGKFESAYSVEGRRLVVSRTLKLARTSIAPDEFGLFDALRKAIRTDRDQTFLVAGKIAVTAGGSTGTDSAELLKKQGLAAIEKKDYASAVDLLRKATQADPKLEDGFFELGRALHYADRDKEAVEAYSRQIEITPFHESAYSWRSASLTQLNRLPESEKDLLKQIEVSPFQAWPYETLASRRLWQGRHREAADLYARAASVEPGKPGRWIDLAWELARDSRPEEARQALHRGRSLDPPDWMKISAAGAYDLIGDTREAADLAEEGLAAMAPRLVSFTAADLDAGDTWSSEYLARAWYVVGSAALATGEDAKAERYLTAAWTMDFSPEAAWALGRLREKQGRFKETAELWTMAVAVPTAPLNLPADREKLIDAALSRLPEDRTIDLKGLPPSVQAELAKHKKLAQHSVQTSAGARLTDLRSLKLGNTLVGDLTEEVVVLMTPDGRIEGLRALSPQDPARFSRAIAKLGTARQPFTAPDDRPFRAARKALLVCSSATPCGLILDLPGLPPLGRK